MLAIFRETKWIGHLLLFYFVSITCFCNAQITGNVQKQGASNHSGITVRIISATNAKVSYSATSNAAGNFSITAPAGNYRVYYFTVGYTKHILNNNTPLSITANQTLQAVILAPQPSRTIAGELAGTLYSDTLYYLSGNCYSLNNKTLTIQSGTIIKLANNATLSLRGTLNNLSAIKFTNWEGEPYIGEWKQITFDLARAINLNNTSFSNGRRISYTNLCPGISNCIFSNLQTIKFTNNSNTLNITGNTIEYADSALVFDSESPLVCNIKNNTIRYANYGIKTDNMPNAIINANRIEHCENGIKWLSYLTANVMVSNNIFTYNTNACKIYVNSQVYNNVFSSCVYSAIDCPDVKNNIFYGASYAALYYVQPTSTITASIQNNLFWNTDDNKKAVLLNTSTSNYIILSNYGGIGYLNANNQPCDANRNFTANPLFIDTVTFQVQPASPVIDAGADISALLATDIEGHPRKSDGNGDGSAFVDVGCYELNNLATDTLRLSGTVYSDLKPVPSCRVILKKFITGNYQDVDSTLTDVNGKYQFTKIKEATYILYARTILPNYVPTYFVNAVIPENAYKIQLSGHIIKADIHLMPDYAASYLTESSINLNEFCKDGNCKAVIYNLYGNKLESINNFTTDKIYHYPTGLFIIQVRKENETHKVKYFKK